MLHVFEEIICDDYKTYRINKLPYSRSSELTLDTFSIIIGTHNNWFRLSCVCGMVTYASSFAELE